MTATFQISVSKISYRKPKQVAVAHFSSQMPFMTSKIRHLRHDVIFEDNLKVKKMNRIMYLSLQRFAYVVVDKTGTAALRSNFFRDW